MYGDIAPSLNTIGTYVTRCMDNTLLAAARTPETAFFRSPFRQKYLFRVGQKRNLTRFSAFRSHFFLPLRTNAVSTPFFSSSSSRCRNLKVNEALFKPPEILKAKENEFEESPFFIQNHTKDAPFPFLPARGKKPRQHIIHRSPAPGGIKTAH